MKVIVCLCALMAAANAVFLNFGGGGGGGGISGGSDGWSRRPTLNQGGWSTRPSAGHRPVGNGLVYKVKVYPEAAGNGFAGSHGGGFSAGPAQPAEPQVIKFIHQKASADGYASGGHSSGPSVVAAPQVIRLIHHQASSSAPAAGFSSGPPSVINVVHQQGSASAAGFVAAPAPAAAHQVIKVIHSQGHSSNSASSDRGYNYGRATPKLIRFIHSSTSSNANHASSGSQQQHVGGAAKVFRVIHERSQSQGQSYVQSQSYAQGQSFAQDQSHASIPVSAPGPNYLTPLESSEPVFNTPAPVYGAPSPAAVFSPPAPAPAPVYSPPAPAPAPVYGPPAFSQTFTAPEPVPVHVPAQTYGPPI